MTYTVTRPNGKQYRPRTEPRAVLCGWEDEAPSSLIVLGTHDIDAATPLANAALHEHIRDVGYAGWALTMHDPEQTWIREAPAGTDEYGGMRVLYRNDPEHGRAAVCWTITEEKTA